MVRGVVAFAVALAALIGVPRAPGSSSAIGEPHWNRSAAETYLDRRASWWMEWPAAGREHGTVCVSCHTTLPYALARRTDSPIKRRLLDSVRTRVRQWRQIAPYYADRHAGDTKAAESRGTESVLNALILSAHDARGGALSADARAAFDNMWALQETSGPRAGAWSWLRFDLEPWEGQQSAYFGASLAVLAVAIAPQQYRAGAAIKPRLEPLRSFLDRDYLRQPLANRSVLLWAATKWPGLIDREHQAALVDDLVRAQRHDGGWSVDALNASSCTSCASWTSWLRRSSWSPSDGYATGLCTLALLPTDGRAAAERGVAWLIRNQDSREGDWPASSLNARRDPRSDAAAFMSDAATAFAVLALDAAASGEVRR